MKCTCCVHGVCVLGCVFLVHVFLDAMDGRMSLSVSREGCDSRERRGGRITSARTESGSDGDWLGCCCPSFLCLSPADSQELCSPLPLLAFNHQLLQEGLPQVFVSTPPPPEGAFHSRCTFVSHTANIPVSTQPTARPSFDFLPFYTPEGSAERCPQTPHTITPTLPTLHTVQGTHTTQPPQATLPLLR